MSDQRELRLLFKVLQFPIFRTVNLEALRIVIPQQPNYKEVAKYCNSWRVYGDIWDAWESITSIIYWYGDNPGNFTQVAGPGQWNDGDMVSVNTCNSTGLTRFRQACFRMWPGALNLVKTILSLRQIQKFG